MQSKSRREFIKSSLLASSLLFVPNFLQAINHPDRLARIADANGRRLVVVQLGGGNDGLNTVVPYQNDIYYRARPGIALPSTKLLSLEKDLAFNPVMEGLKKLFDEGQVGIFNSVGYPNPDRSHFRSMDIWHTGSDATEYLSTGWLGRYLDSNCAACATSFNGIEVDDTLSLAMKGRSKKGLALENAKKLYQTASDPLYQHLPQPGSTNSELDYLYKTVIETTASADYLYQKAKIYQSKTSYPDSRFSRNLKTAAELICSGADTRVFYVSLPGFDTHANQVGQQGRLLGELSEGLYAFVQDLKSKNEFNNTLILVFSEFGRRVKQNASNGTDHGTANNLFLLGGGLKRAGILNEAPDLATLDEGDLRHQLDFRSVYATILDNWLASDADAILGKKFNRLTGLV
ncbi:hypothetical protein AAE02nite_08550 [Adhaeribacter aerolatus]|uniref:Twin-arginine translocation pathway signal n=1 Tax=Adhaeribacter aerolatus TaxID=670289 RepID=A0A512ATZ8_9BACT|nr:DUF1501 domain-containing protein [Adhaeribacter aerolatus]GEO03191.1 hypothetical protein AAE02nite_08550 [Adhaeribacter aerolatus]